MCEWKVMSWFGAQRVLVVFVGVGVFNRIQVTCEVSQASCKCQLFIQYLFVEWETVQKDFFEVYLVFISDIGLNWLSDNDIGKEGACNKTPLTKVVTIDIDAKVLNAKSIIMCTSCLESWHICFFLFGGVLLICVSMLFFLFSCCSCQPDSTSDWNNSMIAIMYAHWKGNRLLISHLHTSTYMDTDMFDEFIYCGNDIILNIRILGLLVLQHPHHGCGCYLPKTTSTDGCLTSQCKVKFVKTCYWNYPSIYQLYQLLSFRPVGTRIPTNIFTTCWLVWTTPQPPVAVPGRLVVSILGDQPRPLPMLLLNIQGATSIVP